jgi:hypothetical protein
MKLNRMIKKSPRKTNQKRISASLFHDAGIGQKQLLIN